MNIKEEINKSIKEAGFIMPKICVELFYEDGFVAVYSSNLRKRITGMYTYDRNTDVYVKTEKEVSEDIMDTYFREVISYILENNSKVTIEAKKTRNKDGIGSNIQLQMTNNKFNVMMVASKEKIDEVFMNISASKLYKKIPDIG